MDVLFRVGDSVLFCAPVECGIETYAAIVTRVSKEVEPTADLVTFGPNSVYFQHGIKFSKDGPKPGCFWNRAV